MGKDRRGLQAAGWLVRACGRKLEYSNFCRPAFENFRTKRSAKSRHRGARMQDTRPWLGSAERKVRSNGNQRIALDTEKHYRIRHRQHRDTESGYQEQWAYAVCRN